MFRLWIVVANQAGARIVEYTGKTTGMKVIRTQINAEVEVSVRPGSERREVTDRAAENFARELTTQLDRDRSQGHFDDLILVAEPGFLGRIKGSMKKETLEKVVAVQQKNFGEMTDRELLENLKKVVEEYNPLLSGAMT